MSIGVCYFPEHWPRDRWETDVEQMAEAGIEYVRMAEFSWSVLEPERGTFEFEWLDEIVELIGENGMQVVLCTPTAAPPRWLAEDRPEILQRDRDGTVRHAGSRRHYCFNSEAYREETERVVSALAEHYADDPTVIGWQTDNEYGCHGTAECYCEDCAEAFRDWLRERYGDARAVNESWGTTFWSQHYDAIDQIEPPRPTPASHHPSLLLDYARFTSDSVVDYNRLQVELLREAKRGGRGAGAADTDADANANEDADTDTDANRTDGSEDDWFVTHNFMNLFPAIDLSDISEDLDLLSWDSYPTGHVQQLEGETAADELRVGDPDTLSLNHDIYRSALDRPFWVMEQQPGDVNWPPHSAQPAEGAMRLWAHHATAHGADAVVYFRWRRCLEAQEQYHVGLRKADGSPDRGYHDAERAAGELADLRDLEHVDAPVALLHDYENCWALDEQPHAPDFDYWGLLAAFYDGLRARGVQVDVVHPESTLERYDAVVAPTLHLVTPSLADHLTEYVDSGGQLLLGPRTGVKDESDKFRPTAQPGPLADLVGATVDQHETVPAHLERAVRRVDGADATRPIRTWAEWLEPDAGTTLLEHAGDDVTAGRTAAVTNAVGDGRVVYCGVWPEADLADDLARSLLERAEIDHTDRLPDGIRVAERDGHTWVFNFTSGELAVEGVPEDDWRLGSADVGPFDLSIAATELPDGLSVRVLE